MPSIFTRIVREEIPCHKILEDERFFAFMEIKPVNPGHVLVIPKKEVDYLFDLDDATLAGLMVFAKRIAAAIKKAVPCKKIGVMVAGLEVPHAHVHLIPILGGIGELSFSRAQKSDDPTLAWLAKKIRESLV